MRFIDTAELSEYCDASIWRGRGNVEENGKIVVTRFKLVYINLSIFHVANGRVLGFGAANE